MDRRLKRYAIISVLAVIIYSLGFLSYYIFVEMSWECPVCSYDGGQLTPLIGEQYAPAVLYEINTAESSIDVLLYEMKFYETNNSVRQLEEALLSAHRRGVNVRILLDQSEWNKVITSLTKENWKTADYFYDQGLKVKFDSLKQTTHDKLLIIDGETVVIGSTNWGYSAFERNNEASIIIRNIETAGYFKKYFELLWNQYGYYRPN